MARTFAVRLGGVPRPTPGLFFRLLPSVAWLTFISFWSGQPDVPIEGEWFESRFHGWQSPLAHTAAFSILGLLLRPAIGGRWSLPATALVVSIAGALDEAHQAFTPGRQVELADWIVDSLAGAVGAVVADGRWRRLVRGSGRPPVLTVRRSWALAAAGLAVVSVALTPVGRPVRSEARALVARAAPGKVQVYAGELADASRGAVRGIRVKVMDTLASQPGRRLPA